VRFDPTWPSWTARPRRVIGLSLAAVVVVAAVVVAGVFGIDRVRSPGHASEASPTPVAGIRTDGTGISPGPGLTEPGILMEVSPRADGGFDVTEHVVLQTRVSRVVFTPPSRGAAGATFDKTHAEIKDLRVQGDDGQPLGRVPSAALTRATSVPLGGTTSTLVLHYQLSGTSVRSFPSKVGRALAYVRPITSDFDTTLPVRIVSAGTGTLNLTCPGLPVAKRTCVAGTPPHLRVRSALPGSESTVVVQLDIPVR